MSRALFGRGRSVRRLLAVAALAVLAIGAIVLAAPAQPRTAPVLHIRLAARCDAGTTDTPAPCPFDIWIDEVSGAVRERHVVLHTTMEQIFVPAPRGAPGAGWEVVARLSTSGSAPGRWSPPTMTTLPLPYPRSLASLRAAMRRLERQATGRQAATVRGRAAIAVLPPLSGPALPWPLAAADVVYLDRATALPLRIAHVGGPYADVYVDQESTARLPGGFLALPDQQPSLLERLRALVGHVASGLFPTGKP